MIVTAITAVAVRVAVTVVVRSTVRIGITATAVTVTITGASSVTVLLDQIGCLVLAALGLVGIAHAIAAIGFAQLLLADENEKGEGYEDKGGLHFG